MHYYFWNPLSDFNKIDIDASEKYWYRHWIDHQWKTTLHTNKESFKSDYIVWNYAWPYTTIYTVLDIHIHLQSPWSDFDKELDILIFDIRNW